MNKLISIFFVLLSIFELAHAGSESLPVDLKSYIAMRKGVVGPNHAGYANMAKSNNPVCIEMKKVGLGCSFYERVDLTEFLEKHGFSLFPCGRDSGPNFGTNQSSDNKNHCSTRPPNESDNYYTGTSSQNEVLAKSIAMNSNLFTNGNLSASNAGKWKK